MRNIIPLSLALMAVYLVLTPAAKSAVPPDYAGKQIIVKFSKPVTDLLQMKFNETVSPAQIKFSRSLDILNKKYRLKKVEPLFRNFKKRRHKIKNLLKKDKTLLTEKEKHILRRLKRARKNAAVPALDRIYLLDIEPLPNRSLEDVVTEYNQNPDVEYAELNYTVSICKTPNDPLFLIQWPLNNMGQMYPESGKFTHSPGTPDADIDAPGAWDVNTGSDRIVVAVIDTGVDYNHRDLLGNIWFNTDEIPGNGLDDDGNGRIDDIHGYDFINEDSDPKDDNGHGTHCAGIIAAEGNNGLDTTGVCWNTRIMALKFLSSAGTGNLTNAVRAFYYAVENGADVASNSWIGGPYIETVQQAINYAYSQGVIMVAAAGNGNTTVPFYPAYYDNVISVAATDSDDNRAAFSNYGDWIDIAAPGVDILSLRAKDTSIGTVYDPYTTILSGTSMSCPHIAAACALLVGIRPGISIDSIEQAMAESADDIDPEICVSGRLNMYAAMLRMRGSQGTVWIDDDAYSCSALMKIKLFDTDLESYGSQQITVTTDGGDYETVLLTESDSTLGIFAGGILLESGPPNTEDAILQVSHGQVITATYNDDDDGTGNTATVTDTAQVDCEPPVIFNVDIDAPGPEPTVTFQTDEPSTARLLYATVCSANDYTVEDDPILTTNHTIILKTVSPETDYFFVIEAEDAFGNQVTDDNSGNCYSFTTNQAVDLYVPGDHPTIQEAINLAWPGTTVWVADGTYTGHGNRDIDFKARPIIVKSSNGPASCIIDCNGTQLQNHRAFYFHNAENESSVLDGFTITNGYARDGAAIYCQSSRPTIKNCIITANTAGRNGGAIYGCSGYIINCTIADNLADLGGGLYACSGQITNSTVTRNFARFGAGFYACNGTIVNTRIIANTAHVSGGGLYACNGTISLCTVVGNSAQLAGAMISCSGAVNNSIIWANRPQDAVIRNSCVPLYSCVQEGSDGADSIDSDPCFVEPGYWDPNGTPDDTTDDFWVDGDYHISTNSPCVDAGNFAYCMSVPGTDFDNQMRLTGAQIDMGCYETASVTDPDADWLSPHDENLYGTDPNLPDTDSDGLLDGIEILAGTNPLMYDPLRNWCVPDDCATVQQAVFFARPGETVILSPGTYYENLNIAKRDILLTGEYPDDPAVVAATIINADTDANEITTSGRAITFSLADTHNCRIRGLTIADGNTYYGGGIYGGDFLTEITNCTITANKAVAQGGGMYNYDGTIDNCIINQNTAAGGGGLAACNGTISNCTITYNLAEVGGGGLAGCNGKITDCNISSNSAASGGGIFGGSADVVGSIIRNNSAGYGGGIGFCTGSIADCTITGNSAGKNGGGINTCEGPVTDSTISQNSAVNGGGIYAAVNLISNCTIIGNSADYGGGLNSCTAPVSNCIVADNTAVIGAGLYSCTDKINNCTISGNSASMAAGLFACPGPVTNCTITENTAQSFGGGILNFAANELVLTGSVLWANQADNARDQLAQLNVPDPVVNYCCIQGLTGDLGGTGNIPDDPAFMDPNNENFHLSLFSPCINAGDPCYAPEPNETDLDGSPRVIAGRIDIGAFESNHIQARLWLYPQTINRQSRIKNVIAWMHLPEGITKDQIDEDEPLLLYPCPLEPLNQYIFEHGRTDRKRTYVLACYDTAELLSTVPDNGPVDIQVIGSLNTGQQYYGRGFIKILDRQNPHQWRLLKNQ
ncbi:MAG: S8 family serine peptidase [Planctomycetota bacterium]